MPRHLRVAMVTDAILPFHRGGKELRYWQLTRRLATDLDLHVYTMNWWRGRPTTVRDRVVYHGLCRARSLYTRERRSVLQALLFALATGKLLWARFDVLEADHMPYFPLFPLRLVTWLRRKRLVVTWHEVWDPGYWRAYLGLPGYAAWLVERAAMLLPDEIIAASPETAERLRGYVRAGTAVTVAPNGVDLEAIEAAEPVGHAVDVITVGRLLSHKRVDLLLDALAILQYRGLRVSCAVVGTGPEGAALLQQAIRLGLASLVRFEADVQGAAAVYSRIKAARVFVSASEREGFGIAALEALACRTPVITTSAPNNLARHLVARSARGVVCEPTAEGLADAIEATLAQPPTTADDAWLAEFSWDETSRLVRRTLVGSSADREARA